MKRILTFLLSAISFGAFSQYNMSTTYVGHNDINSHRYEPSELDIGEKRFQFGINTYLWSGNTSLSWGTIKNYLDKDFLTEQDKNDFLNEVEGTNLFGGGLAVGIALITVVIKTYGASVANPTESIRNE